jgi:hypothetical protein
VCDRAVHLHGHYIPEELSTRLIGWSPFAIMRNTIPPRDTDEDEEDEDEALEIVEGCVGDYRAQRLL